MDEILKKLLESELLDEATVSEIKAKVGKIEEAAEAKVKKRLEAVYEGDRKRLVAACETMIKEGIEKAVAEVAAEKRALSKLAARAAKVVAEGRKIGERKARKVAEALGVMVEECVTKEMAEFHEERRAERARTVKAVREARAAVEKDRQAFIKRGAVVLESIIDDQLGSKIKELSEDVLKARRNDFGRKIFESFAAEFRTSFYNESAEARKLSSKLAEATRQLQLTKKKAADKVAVLESQVRRATIKASALTERARRGTEITTLLGKLPPAKRPQMKALLESQATSNIRATFKRFLPEVMGKPSFGKVTTAGQTRTRSTLGTGAFVLKEGNRMTQGPKVADQDDDLVRLRVAAGIGRNH